ncbi:hypothetical protein BK816_01925 [Boudabousia tangfeifanii]|uniref:AB hydrolase-1 domain-containing protein n=1 Tax=Boudabousia tangfeifanii TaxID=1912795 RepID=A0A1D9MIT8_9ACTO|nr:alpha/beta hydrolase [Boudabousia tangfeifanii]AOZ72202.1 hypothetical protein BK816_01925 [Boudabousia tangfeifanii]
MPQIPSEVKPVRVSVRRYEGWQYNIRYYAPVDSGYLGGHGPSTQMPLASEAFSQTPAQVYLLVHGLGLSTRYFHRLIAELQITGAVVALELPGFGQTLKPGCRLGICTYAQIVAEVVRNLPAKWAKPNLTMVGHSMGAQVALQAAALVPPNTLVLLGLPAAQTLGPSRLGGRFVWASRHEPPGLARLAIQGYFECGLPTFARALVSICEFSAQPALDALDPKTRVHLIRGEYDYVSPAAWLEEISHYLRGITAEDEPKRLGPEVEPAPCQQTVQTAKSKDEGDSAQAKASPQERPTVTSAIATNAAHSVLFDHDEWLATQIVSASGQIGPTVAERKAAPTNRAEAKADAKHLKLPRIEDLAKLKQRQNLGELVQLPTLSKITANIDPTELPDFSDLPDFRRFIGQVELPSPQDLPKLSGLRAFGDLGRPSQHLPRAVKTLATEVYRDFASLWRYSRQVTPPARWSEGEGPVILALPGINEHWPSLAVLLEYLHYSGWRIMVPDLGTSHPEPSELAKVVDRKWRAQLGTSKVVLLGHSKGGLIAHELANLWDQMAATGEQSVPQVQAIVTLATPYRGSKWGYLFWSKSAIGRLSPKAPHFQLAKYQDSLENRPVYPINFAWDFKTLQVSTPDNTEPIVWPAWGHTLPLFDPRLASYVAGLLKPFLS